MATTAATQRQYERNNEMFVNRRVLTARVEALEERIAAGEEGLERDVVRARRKLDRIDGEIVAANMGLVLRFTRSMTARASADDAADFEAAGVAGLWDAIRTFQPEQGKFGSWAYQRIKAAVLRSVKAIDYPDLSHAEFEGRPEIRRTRDMLIERGEDASEERIAAEVGMNVEQVQRALSSRRAASLDAPVGDDGASTLGDLIDSGAVSIDDLALGGMDADALLA